MIASCKTVNRFKSGRHLQQSPVAFRDRALFAAERFSPGRTFIFRILSFAFCRGWLGFAPCPSLLPGTGLVFASCPSFLRGPLPRAGKQMIKMPLFCKRNAIAFYSLLLYTVIWILTVFSVCLNLAYLNSLLSRFESFFGFLIF